MEKLPEMTLFDQPKLLCIVPDKCNTASPKKFDEPDHRVKTLSIKLLMWVFFQNTVFLIYDVNVISVNLLHQVFNLAQMNPLIAPL